MEHNIYFIMHKNTLPWIEKYRPKTLKDLVIDDNIMYRLKNFVKNKELKNIILTGSPGIGKTSTVQCLSRELLGKYSQESVLELNASDSRGIKIVQDKITIFCKKKMPVIEEDMNKYAKHKIIILDEVDNMKEKTQKLISNIMDHYKNVRFAFMCNTSHKIIESIQSRCIIFHYPRVDPVNILKKLTYIAENEKLNYDKSGLKKIIALSNGDLRHAINNFQIIANTYDHIDKQNVMSFCQSPHHDMIKEIFKTFINNNTLGALKLLAQMRASGYNNIDICGSMLTVLQYSKLNILDEFNKIKIFNVLSETYTVLNKGVDSDLQMTAGIIKMCEI